MLPGNIGFELNNANYSTSTVSGRAGATGVQAVIDHVARTSEVITEGSFAYYRIHTTLRE